MNERKAIIHAWEQALQANRRAALATVVRVNGSAYRRPGARMLVTDDGCITGAISGGCLEGDAKRKALLALHCNESSIVTYDTSGEDDAEAGFQLGCEGVIQVLFEPLDPAGNHHLAITLLKHSIQQRQSSAILSLYTFQHKPVKQPGARLLLMDDGTVVGMVDESIQYDVVKDMQQVLEKRVAAFPEYVIDGVTYHAFIEYAPPPVQLVIVGGGNDVLPVAHIAMQLGWEMRIIDGRNTFASRDRFVSACQVIGGRPAQALEQIQIDDHTVFVLMTHNYQYDLEMLKTLLSTPSPYIGLLGARKKCQRMLQELSETGFIVNEADLSRLYGPVGLDIGAETPAEIALSIVSEIKSVLSHKKGNSLSQTINTIHAVV